MVAVTAGAVVAGLAAAALMPNTFLVNVLYVIAVVVWWWWRCRGPLLTRLDLNATNVIQQASCRPWLAFLAKTPS